MNIGGRSEEVKWPRVLLEFRACVGLVQDEKTRRMVSLAAGF